MRDVHVRGQWIQVTSERQQATSDALNMPVSQSVSHKYKPSRALCSCCSPELSTDFVCGECMAGELRSVARYANAKTGLSRHRNSMEKYRSLFEFIVYSLYIINVPTCILGYTAALTSKWCAWWLTGSRPSGAMMQLFLVALLMFWSRVDLRKQNTNSGKLFFTLSVDYLILFIHSYITVIYARMYRL